MLRGKKPVTAKYIQQTPANVTKRRKYVVNNYDSSEEITSEDSLDLYSSNLESNTMAINKENDSDDELN